jgi:hypothetical protein
VLTEWLALISPEWCLVVVGAVTAGVICWQSVETRRAAQASRDSITHFLAKEKARLSIRLFQSIWRNDPYPFGAQLKAPAIQFKVSSFGPTHAFNVRLFVSFLTTEADTLVTLPEAKEIETKSIFKAEEKDWYPSFHPDMDGSGVLSGIIAGTKYLQLGGKLIYTDVFGEERETRFRYIYKKSDNRNEWVEHGLDSENEAT